MRSKLQKFEISTGTFCSTPGTINYGKEFCNDLLHRKNKIQIISLKTLGGIISAATGKVNKAILL